MLTIANNPNPKHYKIQETQSLQIDVCKIDDTTFTCTLSINNIEMEFPISKQDVDTLVEDYVLTKNHDEEYHAKFIKPFGFSIT